MNLLIVTLLLSLLDDQLFFGKSRNAGGKWSSILGQIANVLVHAAIIYGVVVLFNLKLNGSQVDVRVGEYSNVFVYFIDLIKSCF